ncbi:MAG: rhodanese-related sulfurtransferase [Pantoea sp. Brub]|nr:rhodanese-related sulfurtransferase [Pantoea sp. Brub]
MPALHNLISNQKLKQQILCNNDLRITVSFYKYFYIDNTHTFRDNLYLKFVELQILGRIYIAHEGINAQISVPSHLYQKMQLCLYRFDKSLNNIHMNIALDNHSKSFWVLRIKVRERIISDGIEENILQISKVGCYLTAQEVNLMLDNPKVIFVDMRNDYEYKIGHFANAIACKANTFREQLSKIIKLLENKKNEIIVTYCTGGIRCEKASAWLIYNGFNNVYQVKGGIIEYVNTARKESIPVRFKGKNFVFDARMSEQVSKDVLSTCSQCGELCDIYTNCLNNLCHLLFIQCINCFNKYKNCCSLFCKEKIKCI